MSQDQSREVAAKSAVRHSCLSSIDETCDSTAFVSVDDPKIIKSSIFRLWNQKFGTWILALRIK